MGLDNPLHIAFLVVILLLIFGAKRLPEIGRSLGSGMREFKDSVSGEANKPTLTQTAQQAPQAQQATPAPVQAPAEPTHQA
jgi:sec-independent protein translocase protein TatA